MFAPQNASSWNESSIKVIYVTKGRTTFALGNFRSFLRSQ